MTIHRIINLCALGLVVLDMLWLVIRLVRNGKPNLPEEKGFLVRLVSIYLSSAAIVALCFFIDFGTMANVVINACSVLGIEIANRQLLGIDTQD